ncbi:MAG: MerR family transcriptional regulator [Erysipelotrichaceae bacterium]
MKDYYKIGEISKLYGIGKDSLMYYEELGILTPIRGDNGYRYYKISDIYRLNLIKELRSLDFSMQRIKSFLDHRSIESTKALLEKELALIDQKEKDLKLHRFHIKQRLTNIETALDFDVDKIETIYLEERNVFLMNADITREEDVDYLIKKLQNQLPEQFFIIGNQNIGSQFDLTAFKEHDYNKFKSIFVLLEDSHHGNYKMEAGMYVRGYYQGSYHNNEKCIKKMLRYIEENQLTILKNPLELYRIDIHQTGIVSEYISEVQIHVSASI